MGREGTAVFTVENDWIEYEPTPVRRVAVRGGAACAARVRVERARPVVPLAPPAVEPQAVRGKRSRLRLTRRGRFVFAGLPLLLAASGAFAVLTAPATAEAASTVRSSTVVIGSGDTLWSLAERIAPARDPRDVVAELEAANGLRSAMVEAGRVLVVPAGVAG